MIVQISEVHIPEFNKHNENACAAPDGTASYLETQVHEYVSVLRFSTYKHASLTVPLPQQSLPFRLLPLSIGRLQPAFDSMTTRSVPKTAARRTHTT